VFWRRRKEREHDLERELHSHLESEAVEQQESGLSPEEARDAARRVFGNATLVREDTRAEWGWETIERLAQDLRYAIRLLRKSPAFSVTAVLSLAIGIGMNTAMFTLIDAILLESLPVASPDELVLMAERTGARLSFSLSSPAFRGLAANSALTGLAAFRPWRFRTEIHGETQFANGLLVSGSYFSLLGLKPIIGRTLTPADDGAAGTGAVAVLSYDYWQRVFGGNLSVIGQTIELQDYTFTVVGVTDPRFSGLEPGKEVDITVPLATQPIIMPGSPLLNSENARWLRLIGRRKPNLPFVQAQASLRVTWSQMLAAPAGDRVAPESQLDVLPGGQGLYDLRREFELPLRVLMGAVALVLLLACTNLASLLLARATARRQEISLRISLGATQGRLLQLLTESMLLSAIGGICGTAIAYWAGRVLVGLMSRGRTPIVLDLSLHSRTLMFTVVVTLLTGLLFGMAPAFRVASAARLHGLRVVAGGPRSWTAALIVAQVSLCLVVLACAGLLQGSLERLRNVDAGFRRDHVLLMSIRPAASGYDGPRSATLYQELLQRFGALPGVKSVTLSMDTPLGGVSYTAAVALLGLTGPRSAHMQASVNCVGPQFFETMAIPLLLGRDLSVRDDGSRPQVAVIGESVARGLFPHRNPLGQRIEIGHDSMEIVGVVKDVRYQNLREPVQPMVYRPYLQMPGFLEELFFGIRTVDDPDRIVNVVRRELHNVAPNVPAFTLGTLEERVDATLVRERMTSAVSAWFGCFALLLAAVGLYGRLAYAVVERTREIAIRVALGAARTVVMWTILRQVLVLALSGVAIGLPFAMAFAQAIRSLLFGLAPFDPSTLAAVVIVILGVSAVAGYIPARRASRVDPMVALRYE
jgi:predicted permease